MKRPSPPSELAELRALLREAEETLNAIRHGEIDAVVVSGPQGERIYTLEGADVTSRLLLQEMSEGALTLLPDGVILYCNKRFAALVRIPYEHVIGMPLETFVAPADRTRFDALLRQCRKGGAKAEICIVAGDGAQVPAYFSISRLPLEQEECLCVIVTDLTEQKRHEEILASQTLARAILEQAAEVVVVCDRDGTIIDASRKAHDFCRRNILHEPIHEIFPLSAATSNATCLDACWDGIKLQDVEIHWRRDDGEKFHLLMNVGPLRDAERIIGSVFTFHDITQIKRNEAALRENERRLREQAGELEQQLIASGRLVSLGEITASMAHEFNNPLGVILGFVEDMLGAVEPSHPNYRPLQIVDEEAKRCQKIVQDLMDFGRPGDTTPSPTEVGSVVAHTLQMIEARLYKQKVALTKAIAADLPRVAIDPQQLQQVLLNIYLNALDAMLEGGKLMVAAALESGNPEPMVMITIADTGMGIDPKDLPKIFLPFFTARKKNGLGLGLSICERIVKNYGGRIGVESQLEQGSFFRILLPVNKCPQ